MSMNLLVGDEWSKKEEDDLIRIMKVCFENFGDLKWTTFIYDEMVKLNYNRTKAALKRYYTEILKSKGIHYKIEEVRWSKEENDLLIDLIINRMNDRDVVRWNEQLIQQNLAKRSLNACREQLRLNLEIELEENDCTIEDDGYFWRSEETFLFIKLAVVKRDRNGNLNYKHIKQHIKNRSNKSIETKAKQLINKKLIKLNDDYSQEIENFDEQDTTKVRCFRFNCFCPLEGDHSTFHTNLNTLVDDSIIDLFDDYSGIKSLFDDDDDDDDTNEHLILYVYGVQMNLKTILDEFKVNSINRLTADQKKVLRRRLCNFIVHIDVGEPLRKLDYVRDCVVYKDSKYRVAKHDFFYKHLNSDKNLVIYEIKLKKDLKYQVETSAIKIGLNNIFNKILSNRDLTDENTQLNF